MNTREAVIVGAVRTPVGRRGGVLNQWHPADLLGRTLRDLVARTGIDPTSIDDVIAGCVLQHDQQASNIGRHAVLSAGLPESVPAVTVDRQCGSGQQAVSFAAQGVMAGSYDVAIGCGVESMSQVSIPAAFLPGAPLGPQYSPLELSRYDGTMMTQGPSSELMNHRFELSREDLDAYSTRSHARAHAATQAGAFAEQMVPITADPPHPDGPQITADVGIRDSIDPAKMASLRTVFAEDGRTTAGNSSQLSDGAAALLIAGVPLMFQREFNIPDEKLNANGGSVAIGHPLGSTGARMLTDLLHELERSSKRFGLQTICEAPGTANTTIIERIINEN